MKKIFKFFIALLVFVSILVVNFTLKSPNSVKAETIACALSGDCTIDGQNFPYEGIDIEIEPK